MQTKNSCRLSTADGYWLAGLTDGEGCFALWTRRRRVGRSDNCQCVSFVFKIALRADDREVLERVQRLLGGIGSIQINERKSHNAVYNGRVSRGKPLAQYTVNKKEHLLLIVRIFRKYKLRSKKQRDFDLWSKALERFVWHTQSAPRKWKARTTRTQLRPQEGTPLRRFKRIPIEVYSEIQEYEQAIKAIRVYQETECAA